MGKKLSSIRLHKPSGQAVVTIAGRDFYLGAFGSVESRKRYGELIAESCSGKSIDPLKSEDGQAGITVNELTQIQRLDREMHWGDTSVRARIRSEVDLRPQSDE